MGFFKTDNTQINKEAGERSFIHVGGKPFHALAVALIDQIKNSPTEHNELCTNILQAYQTHYPNAVPNQMHSTPSERLHLFFNNNKRMIDVVESLADVLKQRALDEVFERPELYPEVFEGLPPETLKASLRETDALPMAALRAASAALQVSITVELVEPEKPARRLEIYDNAFAKGNSLHLVLQAQGEHYFPEVTHKELFKYVGLIKSSVKRTLKKEDTEGSIESCLEKIALANQRLLNAYRLASKSLVHLDLTKEHLVDLFIKFFPVKHCTLPGETYLSSIEIMNEKPVSPIFFDIESDPKKLIQTLSMWVSTDQVQSEAFFEYIEESIKNNRTLVR